MISRRPGGTVRGNGAGGSKGSGRMSIRIQPFAEDFKLSPARLKLEQALQLVQLVVDQPTVVVLFRPDSFARSTVLGSKSRGALARIADIVERRGQAWILRNIHAGDLLVIVNRPADRGGDESERDIGLHDRLVDAEPASFSFSFS